MFKGWIGEFKTGFSLWAGLDSNLYHRFHDVIIPSSHGTTQVDHILVSPFGIFVAETKNYKGWIYGSADQSTWTQVIYKSKHKFQNPLGKLTDIRKSCQSISVSTSPAFNQLSLLWVMLSSKLNFHPTYYVLV